MHEIDLDKVIFFSKEDMAGGYYLQKGEHILQVDTKSTYSDINEVLELYNLKKWFKITLRKNYLCKLFCYNEKQVHKSDAHFREKNERDYSSFLPRYRGRKDVCFNKYFSPYHQ